MGGFANLLRPIRFGTAMECANRLYFSSVGFDVCDARGRPLPVFFEIYESIIEGGCGFGFLGNASIDPQSQYTDRGLKLVSNEHAEDLRPLIALTKTKQRPLVVQLQHYGVKSVPSEHDAPRSTGDVTALPDAQIEDYIVQFCDAARLAMSIGAQAIQIHAANGYLLSSFLSPRTNHRHDRWGGNPLKRAELLLEILRRIRALTAGRMAIFVRLQVDDGFGYDGLHVELLDEVIGAMEIAGADAITCATGVAETFGKFLSDRDYTVGLISAAARFLKARTRLPIGFAANLDNLSFAERLIGDGTADFVGFGRAIVADHQFPNKELENRLAAVNRCRWDSYCLRDKKEPLASRVYCCVNDAYLRPQRIQAIYQEKQS